MSNPDDVKILSDNLIATRKLTQANGDVSLRIYANPDAAIEERLIYELQYKAIPSKPRSGTVRIAESAAALLIHLESLTPG